MSYPTNEDQKVQVSIRDANGTITGIGETPLWKYLMREFPGLTEQVAKQVVKCNAHSLEFYSGYQASKGLCSIESYAQQLEDNLLRDGAIRPLPVTPPATRTRYVIEVNRGSMVVLHRPNGTVALYVKPECEATFEVEPVDQAEDLECKPRIGGNFG